MNRHLTITLNADWRGALRAAGEISAREAARRVGRDIKRVHEDLRVLQDLGLVEQGERGGVVCPFESLHIDMQMRAAA
ncbi:MAG: hypothetical protein LCI02_26200 [Proteobacteria bacterium]|nr:hypothetical protein [Pseudomonadota bacterium]